MDGLVYLVHLEQPLAHARHYVGWSASAWNLRLRLAHHRAGSGSRFLAAVTKAGIRFQPVRVVEGTRADERHLKNGKNVARLCPVCRGHRHVCMGCGRLYQHAGWLRRHQLTKGCR
jgi:hypothetical protein